MSGQTLDVELPLEYVYRPPAEAVGDDTLVVVLHGRGADETDLLPVTDHLPPAHVLSLRAPARLMGGYTWYELDMPDGDLNRSQPHAGDFRRSLDHAAETTATASEALDVDTVGLLGFSQGSITSTALLVESPASYDWVVGLHGYLAASHAESEAELDDTPVFLGAGRADQVIPESRVVAAADRLREMGAAVTYEAYDTGHGIAQEELADVVAFVETQ
ncbi:alpha/beta hydrolase [Salinigranum halophilum]|uniref:alpha/beta hydrolase n=1 Tax=Salinigranum halophilum TaxID=2565931 RepID=UPI0010A8EA07|nr:dienelactone hydrolase family protein [Salinigranum halophilum]